MVDIDTSGPGADVDIPEEKPENEIETTEDSSSAPQEAEAEKVEASDEKPEAKEQKDELQDYSKDVQRRIAKLTKKWREAERQKEEAISYAESVMSKQKAMETKLSKLEPGYLDATEKSITSGIEAAKARLAKAREDGNLGEEAEAMTQISELGYRKAKLLEAKESQTNLTKEVKQEATEPTRPWQTPRMPDPKAEAWAEENSWFGKDEPMTFTAMSIHKKLTEQEGYETSSDEYYAEINKRMRLAFPQKFDTNSTKVENTTKPTQIVASARRSVKPGRKTIRLTPSEVAIAKRLGLPLEEYAKHKKITKEVQHMENEKIRTSRASQSRDKDTRPKTWTPPSSLDAPPAPDGFRHRWIRAEVVGFDDTKNMSGKMRSGWELVRADEYPESQYPSVKDGKYAGVIGVGGLLLARIPEEIAKSREAFFREQTQARDEAVNNDLMKEQHSSMPINAERQSRVTFGGSKK